MSGRQITLAAGLLALAATVTSTRAKPVEADLAARCARIGTDDALRPLPPSLAGTVRSRFDLPEAPASALAHGIVWRCDDGQTLVCLVGANLPCGKLDARTALPAAEAWCEAHAGAPIPAVVTGHNRLWRWHCDGTRAVLDGQAWLLDPRGFARETWRPLTTRH